MFQHCWKRRSSSIPQYRLHCAWPPFNLLEERRAVFYPAALDLHVRTFLWNACVRSVDTITPTQASGFFHSCIVVKMFVFQVFEMLKCCVGPWQVHNIQPHLIHWWLFKRKVPDVVWTCQSVKVELYLFNRKWTLYCGAGNIREHLNAISAYQCKIWSVWELFLMGLNYVNVLYVLFYFQYINKVVWKIKLFTSSQSSSSSAGTLQQIFAC